MSRNWGYVVAGYVLAGSSISAYAVWLRRRLRRARRSLPDEGRG